MGVKGLTTFIENNHQQYFEKHQLHSTKVVIDGYGIMSKFYFAHNIDPGNHGGEFQNFYSHAADYFSNLAICGIKPYVVFDGGYDMDGKKFETMRERCRQKIGIVKGIIGSGRGFLMPTMASEVLKKVLRDLRVPFVFGDFEADRDIAVLANELSCPVLGQDSDFFIMDIHEGYVPFDSIEWENLVPCSSDTTDGMTTHDSRSGPKKSFIRCQRFRLSRFCNHFQVDACLMPLFASLSGNDYLQSISLKGFFGATKNIHQHRADQKQHPRRKGQNKFCELLHHLTFYSALPDCLDEVIKHVSPSHRSKVRTALQTSCDMYDVSQPSQVCDYFKADIVDLSTNPLVLDHGIPVPFLRQLHLGEVPTMCLNIFLNRMYFVGTQIENLSEKRSSACADELLSVLYGIMLTGVPVDDGGHNKAITVDIYDRDGMDLRCYKVKPLLEVSSFGAVLSFTKVFQSSEHQRKLFLLAVLEARDVNLDRIPVNFQLALLVTLYWFKRAEPTVNRRHLCALVLSWMQGVAWCKNNAWRLQTRSGDVGFDKTIHWPDNEIRSVLQNFDSLTTRKRSKDLDLDACHSFAQWVSCYRAAEYINAALSLVYPRNDMTVLFNGLLLHNLFFRLNELHPDHHQDWVQHSLFLHAPYACGLSQQLMAFFDANLGDLFQARQEASPHPQMATRGRGGKQARHRNKRGAGRGGRRGQRRGGMKM